MYIAVTEFVPTGSYEVVNDAEPPLRVPLPSTVLPFINETVSPFGGIPTADATTAVKITDSSLIEGFGEELSPVVVFAGGESLNTVPQPVAGRTHRRRPLR